MIVCVCSLLFAITFLCFFVRLVVMVTVGFVVVAAWFAVWIWVVGLILWARYVAIVIAFGFYFVRTVICA